ERRRYVSGLQVLEIETWAGHRRISRCLAAVASTGVLGTSSGKNCELWAISRFCAPDPPKFSFPRMGPWVIGCVITYSSVTSIGRQGHRSKHIAKRSGTPLLLGAAVQVAGGGDQFAESRLAADRVEVGVAGEQVESVEAVGQGRRQQAQRLGPFGRVGARQQGV